MVSWFVHDQDIRFFHHQLTEQHAALFTTGQHFDFLLDVILTEQQAAQHTAHSLLVITFLFPLAHPVEHSQIGVEVFGVILRVIADFGIFRPFNRTAIRRQFTHQRFDQRGFTDTVGTDDRHLFAHFHHHVETFEQRAIVIAFAQVFDFQNVAIQLFILFKANEWVLTAGSLHFFNLDLIDLFQTRSRLTGFGGVRTETADE